MTARKSSQTTVSSDALERKAKTVSQSFLNEPPQAWLRRGGAIIRLDQRGEKTKLIDRFTPCIPAHLMKYEGTPMSEGWIHSEHSARRRSPVTSGSLIHLQTISDMFVQMDWNRSWKAHKS